MKTPALVAVVLACAASVVAQQREFDLLIRGGHVIDAKNGIDAVRDVAIAGGKIAALGASIAPERATQVADARGMYVVPGLLDIHAHVFYGTEADAAYSNGTSAIPPDGFTFRSGVTTVVDAGGAGWRNFPQFQRQVIDRSRTRVLAFLNIVGSGMKGGPIEQNLGDMDAKLTAARARQFPGLVVGVKTAHYSGPEWAPVDRAVEAGKQAGIPVMVDFGQFAPERPFEELVTRRLRPGDIYTHTFLGRVPMLDGNGTLRRYLAEAQKRGVIFDVGHGGGSFLFRQAVPATRQGFWPDTISTDIHTGSMNAGMKDMANVISKMLILGMPLREAIEKSTWAPAQAIGRPDLGHLDIGAAADVAVFRLHEGDFGFLDVSNARFDGTRKLECELTVRDGRVVWDLNGIASIDWAQAAKR